MKKSILILIIFISCAALAFTFQQNKILGRWEAKMPDNTVVGVVYKPDHTFQAYVNKKVFVSGNYELRKDTLAMSDSSCPIKGLYKVTFFADSVRYNVIQDTCSGRKHDVDKVVAGRVKATQTIGK